MADIYNNASDFGLIAPASAPDNILPLYVLTADMWDMWHKAAAEHHKRWLDAQGFKPRAGRVITLPGLDGSLTGAVAIIGERPIWDAAAIANGLPEQTWQIDSTSTDRTIHDSFLLGWAL
ncbi:MAG: leucyl aminopeptidase family protein, partial [Candidatus Puniceispirillum sp.]